MRCRRRFSQQSGSGKRHRDERSESPDDSVHGCLSDLTVFGGRNEPARQMNRNPPKTASQLEDPPANQNGGLTVGYVIGRLQTLLLDGCSIYCL
jgi:hypothetical protein